MLKFLPGLIPWRAVVTSMHCPSCPSSHPSLFPYFTHFSLPAPRRHLRLLPLLLKNSRWLATKLLHQQAEQKVIVHILSFSDSVQDCPRNCHGNGECVSGLCHCFPGFLGADCAKGIYRHFPAMIGKMEKRLLSGAGRGSTKVASPANSTGISCKPVQAMRPNTLAKRRL